MSLRDMMAIRQVEGATIAPDGHAIAFVVTAWDRQNVQNSAHAIDTAGAYESRSHIWIVSTNGGEPRQVTFGESGESQPQWSPDGRYLAFVAARNDEGENATAQIWSLPLAGGEAREVTHGREDVTSFTWSPDGSRIAYVMADTLSIPEEHRREQKDDAEIYEEDFQMSHIWVIDVPTGVQREIAHGPFTVSDPPSWSPDGTRLAFSASPTPLLSEERRDAYVVMLASERIEKISRASIVRTNPEWSPDGATIAFTILPQSHTPHVDGMIEREIGIDHLALYDVASKEVRDVSQPTFDASIWQIHWAPDSRRIIFTTGERAYRSVYAYDLAARTYTKIAGGLLFDVLSYSANDTQVTASMESSNAPADVYVSDPSFTGPRKLTDLNPEVRQRALGLTDIVQWKSMDGSQIEGVLVLPVGYRRGVRYPLLVEVHGGPTGETDAGFGATSGTPAQFWAGKGWAVFYPNPRGSTGYGQRFMRANIGDWGKGDYQDIMSGVDHLIEMGIADSSRMAIEGWSYGGYMTAWVVTHTSRFKAARMGAGISDVASMYSVTDIPTYISTFFNGIPGPKTLGLYRARSPITFVDRITTPLLILHGKRDARVPVGQSLAFFRALKDRGKPVRLVLYPREGHGLQEYYHRLDRMQRDYAWISSYTLGTTVRTQ